MDATGTLELWEDWDPPRVCQRCRRALPVDAFQPDVRYRGGHAHECRACNLDRQRQKRRANPEATAAKRRAAYLADKSRTQANSAAWRAANSERVKAKTEAYRRANAERLIAARALWRAVNRERVNEYGRRHRAAKRAAMVGRFTVEDLYADWERRGLSGCAYCPDGQYEHMDHVVPLSRGGSHSMDNLVPACGRCNMSKGARLLSEWLAGHQERLAREAAGRGSS
jgi:5-methylcytosine-specific restriction endonuclease McrA